MPELSLAELCSIAERSGVPLPLPLIGWLSRSVAEAMAGLHANERTFGGLLTEELVLIPSAGPLVLAPPETKRSHPAAASRADVESLARILVAIWTAGTSDAEQHRDAVATGSPDFVAAARSDLPVGLDAVLLSCFAGGRESRYGSAGPLAVRLARLFGDVGEDGARGELNSLPLDSPELRAPAAPPAPAASFADDDLQVVEVRGFQPAPDLGAVLGPETPCLAHLAGFRGQVKGALVKSVYASLIPAQQLELRRYLVPEFQDILDEGLMPSSWYPEIFFAALLRGARRIETPGTLMHQVLAARAVFTDMARSYHRLFYRIVGPTRLMAMMGRAWGLYHTVGTVIIHDKGDTWFKGAYADNPAILEPGYAEGTIGSSWGALRLAGAKAVRIEFQRKAPDRIELDVRWS